MTSAEDKKPTWKEKRNAFGKTAVEKSTKWSDWAGLRLNNVSEKLGNERFYPVTGDFPQEMDKAARILRAFTVDGLETTIEGKDKSRKKVLRKIPPSVIRSACGLAIFTSMRSGIAPFGGSGGAGIVVARLEDGSWSAPSAMSPNNLSAGLMLGIDIYDAVLVIRTPAALASFATHKATLGTDIGVAAGPFGAGAAAEMGLEKAPVLSYVRTRGLYAGIQLVGQIFVDRFDENAKMYHWPGVKAGDILSGKVRVPHEAASLHTALRDAESGVAQQLKGEGSLDMVVPEVPDSLVLADGEVLKLPPTPTMSLEEERRESLEEARRASREVSRSSSPFARSLQGSEAGLGLGEETERELRAPLPPPPKHHRTVPPVPKSSSSSSSSSMNRLPPPPQHPSRPAPPLLPARRAIPPPPPSSTPTSAASSSSSPSPPQEQAAPPVAAIAVPVAAAVSAVAAPAVTPLDFDQSPGSVYEDVSPFEAPPPPTTAAAAAADAAPPASAAASARVAGVSNDEAHVNHDEALPSYSAEEAAPPAGTSAGNEKEELHERMETVAV